MKKLFPTVAFLAFAAASAASVTVNLNGKPVTLTTTTIGGVSYVKTADLQKAVAGAGAPMTATGGSGQVAATEGCMNQWLFNGVVRFRVQKVEAANSNWNATLEVKNGLSKPMSISSALGINLWGDELSLTTSDGNTLMDSTGGGDEWGNGIRNKLPPGSGIVVVKTFPRKSDNPSQPQKLIFYIDPKSRRDESAKYTVPDPSFRVDLTCKK